MKKLKLTNLSRKELEKIRGGYLVIVTPDKCCGCGCYYANSGGSSTNDNGDANFKGGLWSK